jgi:inorganic pyrophosphatase
MLHYLYNYVEELLSVDDVVYSSYQEAYTACRRHHSYPDDYYADPETDESPDDDGEDDLEVEPEPEDEGPLADFEAYARRRPDDQG